MSSKLALFIIYLNQSPSIVVRSNQIYNVLLNILNLNFEYIMNFKVASKNDLMYF